MKIEISKQEIEFIKYIREYESLVESKKIEVPQEVEPLLKSYKDNIVKAFLERTAIIHNSDFEINNIQELNLIKKLVNNAKKS